jgi:hypothetical protein
MANIDYTIGPARVDLTTADAADLDAQRGRNVLVEDLRRTRPAYFDGRFLAARDLTREQLYALTRQADLGTAHRGGVIRGLSVARSGDTLQIAAGTGFTEAGELVTLAAPLAIAIGLLPDDDELALSSDAAAAVARPASGRSGLFVLGLRPGEYTTNRTIRYPLTLLGTPGSEDGDIVEATQVALHRLRFDGDADLGSARSRLVRSVLFEGGGGFPADMLPLAVVALARGSIAWLDVDLARREVAADDAPPIGLGQSSRSLREAHFRQYDRQLTELVDQLRVSSGLRFAASTYFPCLPPVGRLPVAAIDGAQLSQAYFPPQMTVALSVVARDELPALIESAFHLPPIDLQGGDDDFDFTYVHVLIPLDAPAIARLQLQPVTVLRPVDLPIVLARRPPVAALRDFLARRAPTGPEFGSDGRTEPGPLLAAWRQALAQIPDQMAWYVRVPSLSTGPVAVFDPPPKTGKEKDIEKTASTDKAIVDKVQAEKPVTDKPVTDKPVTEKAAAEKPVTDKVAADKPVTDKAIDVDKAAAVDKVVTDKPATDKPAIDKTIDVDKATAVDKVITDKAAPADKPVAIDKAVTEKPVIDKPVALDKGPLDKVIEKTAEKTIEKIAEKTIEKTAEKTAEKTIEKIAEKTAEKTIEKTAEKTAEKTIEKTAEKIAEKPADKVVEKPTDKVRDVKAVEKAPAAEKVRDIAIPADVAHPAGTATPAVIATTPPATVAGRTFVTPAERPDVGNTVITKTRDT